MRKSVRKRNYKKSYRKKNKSLRKRNLGSKRKRTQKRKNIRIKHLRKRKMRGGSAPAPDSAEYKDWNNWADRDPIVKKFRIYLKARKIGKPPDDDDNSGFIKYLLNMPGNKSLAHLQTAAKDHIYVIMLALSPLSHQGALLDLSKLMKECYPKWSTNPNDTIVAMYYLMMWVDTNWGLDVNPYYKETLFMRWYHTDFSKPLQGFYGEIKNILSPVDADAGGWNFDDDPSFFKAKTDPPSGPITQVKHNGLGGWIINLLLNGYILGNPNSNLLLKDGVIAEIWKGVLTTDYKGFHTTEQQFKLDLEKFLDSFREAFIDLDEREGQAKYFYTYITDEEKSSVVRFLECLVVFDKKYKFLRYIYPKLEMGTSSGLFINVGTEEGISLTTEVESQNIAKKIDHALKGAISRKTVERDKMKRNDFDISWMTKWPEGSGLRAPTPAPDLEKAQLAKKLYDLLSPLIHRAANTPQTIENPGIKYERTDHLHSSYRHVSSNIIIKKWNRINKRGATDQLVCTSLSVEPSLSHAFCFQLLYNLKKNLFAEMRNGGLVGDARSRRPAVRQPWYTGGGLYKFMTDEKDVNKRVLTFVKQHKVKEALTTVGIPASVYDTLVEKIDDELAVIYRRSLPLPEEQILRETIVFENHIKNHIKLIKAFGLSVASADELIIELKLMKKALLEIKNTDVMLTNLIELKKRVWQALSEHELTKLGHGSFLENVKNLAKGGCAPEIILRTVSRFCIKHPRLDFFDMLKILIAADGFSVNPPGEIQAESIIIAIREQLGFSESKKENISLANDRTIIILMVVGFNDDKVLTNAFSNHFNSTGSVAAKFVNTARTWVNERICPITPRPYICPPEEDDDDLN